MHRNNVRAHKVVPMPGFTTRTSLGTLEGYAGDYDGDEETTIFVSSIAAKVDATELMGIKNNLVGYSGATVTIIQHTLLMVYKMCVDKDPLSRADAFDIATKGDMIFDLPPSSGYMPRDVLSLVFPMDFVYDTNSFSIRKRILSGLPSKEFAKKFVLQLALQYSNDECVVIIDTLTRVCYHYEMIRPSSIGLNDCMMDTNVDELCRQALVTANGIVKTCTDERTILLKLNGIKTQLLDMKDKISPSIRLCIDSGAKGDYTNALQMTNGHPFTMNWVIGQLYTPHHHWYKRGGS